MSEPRPLDEPALQKRLSQISTTWTVVLQAHGGPAPGVSEAQQHLLQRYSPAVYRYLLGAVHDPDVADELFQEFALRLVRGDFKGADPERGRFRRFLKTALYHLVVDHRRRRQPAVLLPDLEAQVAERKDAATAGEEFAALWRAEVMARCWEALAAWEAETGQPLWTVLRFRTDHPDLDSAEMAAGLSQTLARPVSAEWVRKRLHQAREKFKDLVLDEVAQDLDRPAGDLLAEELLDLGLLEYCRSALARRARGAEAARKPQA